MRKRKPPETPSTQLLLLPQLLTIPEVAAMLKIGRTKVYDLIKTDSLPVVQIGSAKRVPVASLNEWLEHRRKAS